MKQRNEGRGTAANKQASKQGAKEGRREGGEGRGGVTSGWASRVIPKENNIQALY